MKLLCGFEREASSTFVLVSAKALHPARRPDSMHLKVPSPNKLHSQQVTISQLPFPRPLTLHYHTVLLSTLTDFTDERDCYVTISSGNLITFPRPALGQLDDKEKAKNIQEN